MSTPSFEVLPALQGHAVPMFCARNRHHLRSRIETGASHANAIRIMAAHGINSGEAVLEDIERMAGDLLEKLSAMAIHVHELKASDE